LRILDASDQAHLVDQIADSIELSKEACAKIVDSLFAAMTKALQAGERVDIRGLGTFKVKDKAARQARKPVGQSHRHTATRPCQTGDCRVGIATGKTTGFG